MLINFLLVPLGLLVGAYGTLIGAGGGFVLVPVLLLLFPRESPNLITTISLGVVFFNALSGTIAYFWMKRVEFRSGIYFALATVPGAIAGAFVVRFIHRGPFDLVFGLLLLAMSAFIFINPTPKKQVPKNLSTLTTRTLTCSDGTTYSFSFNLKLGVGLSFIVGFISSMLGIGGGIIHVPVLVNLLYFPTHIATATSHFVLVISALTGSATHVFFGDFAGGLKRTLLLAAGVVVGAQIGAKLSVRTRGTAIVRLLAVALGFVGIRLLLTFF